MSEPIYMSIEIGGELHISKLEGLFSIIKDEGMDMMDGPPTDEWLKVFGASEEELPLLMSSSLSVEGKKILEARMRGAKRVELSAQWGMTTNYGECDDIKAFCVQNALSYEHYYSSGPEWDAGRKYWVPGMKEELSVQDSEESGEVISIQKVRPLFNLLVAVGKEGKGILDSFKGDEEVKRFVQIGKRSLPQMYTAIEKRINNIMPVPPVIPPLTVTF